MEESWDEDEQETLYEHQRWVVDPGQAIVRIDKFLMARLPNVTRTKIQGGIHEGFVKVNDNAVIPNCLGCT
jgi:23S rRNA pseudouridine1911/1915/1917 synthase